MTRFHYKVIGLPNVFVEGVDMRQEIDGEIVTVIPAVGRLHRAVAEAIVTRPWPLSGAELRFLRTELELCDGAGSFPEAVGVELDDFLAIEHGDHALDPETEKRVRWLAVNELDLPVTVKQAFAKQGTRPHELPDIVIEPTESTQRYAVRPLNAQEAGESFDNMRETSGRALRTHLVTLVVDTAKALTASFGDGRLMGASAQDHLYDVPSDTSESWSLGYKIPFDLLVFEAWARGDEEEVRIVLIEGLDRGHLQVLQLPPLTPQQSTEEFAIGLRRETSEGDRLIVEGLEPFRLQQQYDALLLATESGDDEEVARLLPRLMISEG